MFVWACTGDDTPANPPDDTPNELDVFVPPSYNDNYTNISDWSQRSLWNLANLHDPTVMLADDGYFYMYQTDASYGNAHAGHGHFHARRSKNLVDWEYLGGTMEVAPNWVKSKLNEYRTIQGLPPIENPSYGYWAPVARNLGNGRYRMYYSIIIDNYIKTGKLNTVADFDNSWTERAFIGMAETTDPASNKWEDKGFVVCSASDKGMNDWYRSSTGDWNAYFLYNAIDPTYTITKEGEHWLTYGSWHSGIVTLQVEPENGKPLATLSEPWNIQENSPYGKRIAKRGASRWQGSEGPEIIYNPETDYYYLFLAYDELSVAYNTRVARSRKIDGPYLGIDGQPALTANEILPVVTHPYRFMNSYGWVGLSHCAIFNDRKGNWYYVSQGRMPKDVPGINVSNAIMMGHVRAISWTTDGWPMVMPERYGAVPSIPVEESELTGDWEHIDLSYSYAKQKESVTMTLSTNHMITAGPWKGGSWSYDATKGVLTANNVKLYLRREVDWEATPRKHTIVYTGYTNTKTYCGKKK
jgi:beta-xylosidase